MSLQQDSARVPNPVRTPVARKCPQCGGPVHYEGLTHVECSTRGCENYALPPNGSKYTAGTFDYAQALIEHAAGGVVEYCLESEWANPWMVCEDPTHMPITGPKQRWRLSTVLDPAAPSPFAPIATSALYPNGTHGNWAWAQAEESDGRGATLEFYSLTSPNWVSCSPNWIGAGTAPRMWRHKP